MEQGRWDAGALGRAALEHADVLYRLARHLARDDAHAEDLVQETFTRALAAAHQFEPGTDLRAWLLRILRNLHLGELRGERRRGALAAVRDDLSVASGAQDAAARREPEAMRLIAARDVERALASLSEEARTMILLQLEGLAEAELAEVFGCPAGTVKSRLARARATLRDRLRAYSWRALP